MQVFIENEAGSNQKNIFDESAQQYIKSYTVSRMYPYPYGFIPNTTSGDGDNLDCFVLTNKYLKSGTIHEVEVIGLMKQIEDGQEDHKILAVLVGESILITDEIKKKLVDFAEHVFDHLEGKTMEVGEFCNKEVALNILKNCKISIQKR